MADILNSLFSETGMLISGIMDLLCSVTLILFIHFSAKHRNYKLSLGWYIAGFLFPLITAFVFLSKRKKFPGENMKVCPFCGDKFPDVYQVCGRCLIDLPENKEEEKKKEKLIAKISGWAFSVIFTVGAVITVAALIMTAMYIFERAEGLNDYLLDDSNRISCVAEDGSRVYYDKMGNTYENGYDVPVYGKDGEVYTYKTDEESDEYGYYNSYYVTEDGKEYDSYYCYVDVDGYFFYDEDDALIYPDYLWEDEYGETEEIDEDAVAQALLDNMPETFTETVDFIFDEIFGMMEYRYYETYYVDGEDNIYYWAEEASWNEKGELITAENDPNPVVE